MNELIAIAFLVYSIIRIHRERKKLIVEQVRNRFLKVDEGKITLTYDPAVSVGDTFVASDGERFEVVSIDSGSRITVRYKDENGLLF